MWASVRFVQKCPSEENFEHISESVLYYLFLSKEVSSVLLLFIWDSTWVNVFTFATPVYNTIACAVTVTWLKEISCLSILIIRSSSLSFMTVNEESLGFGLSVGQKKPFKDVTLDLWWANED